MGVKAQMLAARAADESVMAARIVVIAKDSGTEAQFPATITVSGVVTTIWDRMDVTSVGGYPTRVYTSAGGSLIAIQRIAVSGTRVLCVVWAPAGARDALSTWLQRVMSADDAATRVLAQWAIVVDGSGNLTSPALEADAGALATAVKALWPAGWRVLLAGDAGDPRNGVPATGPSGARCIGAVLA